MIMKMQLAIAAGVLLTLGTAVATTLNESAAVKSTSSIESVSQIGSKESAQVLALWKTHASSSGSIPLARPL
jgi:hypothetical protein